MKKLLLSLFVLFIIILSGVLIIRFFKSSSSEISENIERTSTLVTQGNWDDAKTSIEKIEKEWDMTEKSWTLLTDHIEIDNIELSMKKSKEYIETKTPAEALAELESLKFMVQHIYTKELPNLKNIF